MVLCRFSQLLTTHTGLFTAVRMPNSKKHVRIQGGHVAEDEISLFNILDNFGVDYVSPFRNWRNRCVPSLLNSWHEQAI
jgi:hypothetical protein